MHTQTLSKRLFEIGAVKFGMFTLKSGLESPIYMDLRVLVSYPQLLKELSEALYQLARPLHFDLLCGVPYTALPLATCMSVDHSIPMLMRRKEAKKYGTKKLIEGHSQEGQRCLIVEDLITSGTSILETVEPLQDLGLKVSDAVLLVDREQGGVERLKNLNIHVHALFTLSSILEQLHKANLVDANTYASTLKFIHNKEHHARHSEPAQV